jgi:four helix bundle protein
VIEGTEEPPFPERVRRRTKTFALEVVRLFRGLPKTEEARVIGKQLLRSATSVAANYRAAGRSRSKAEFIAKIGMVVEEADESLLWLELLKESGITDGQKIDSLLKEAAELVAMFSASRQTATRGQLSVNHPITRSPITR